MKNRLKIILITILFILLFSVKVNASDELYDIKVAGNLDYTKAQEVLKIVNEERAAEGLSALEMDKDLMESAMIRAAEIGIYFDHTRPNGTSCFSVISKAYGENIAAGSTTAEGTMNQWMNSSGHRANILKSNYKSIGIGVFQNGSIYYWVQLFGLSNASEVSTKTGTVATTKSVSISKDIVNVYAYTIKDTYYYNYFQPEETGYFRYGIANAGWSSVYSPGVASDYTFTTSNSNIISIDKEGNFKAESEGEATISVCLKNDSTKCYSEKITVEANPNAHNGVYYDRYTGNYLYMKNNKIQTTFTGIAEYEGTNYYFKNGYADFTYTGFASKGTEIYYVEKGKVTFNYNNLVMYNGEWSAIINSKLEPSYTGLATNKNGTYYLEKGKLSFKYNGTYKDSKGDIYVIKNSKVDTSFTGIKNVNGINYYFKNGKVDYTYKDTSFTGLKCIEGTWYYLKDSSIDYKYNGLATNSNGTYYVNNGKITFKHNDLVLNNGTWVAVVNSKVQPKYTGLASNKNGTYYLEKGNLSFKYNGTYKDGTGNIYVLKNSKVNTSFTGLKCVDGTWYYFKKGTMDSTYNGLATNSNGTYYVNNGKVTFKHNELIYYNKRWVAVVNSKVNNSYTGLSSNKNGTYLVIKGTMDFSYTGLFLDSKANMYSIKNNKVMFQY